MKARTHFAVLKFSYSFSVTAIYIVKLRVNPEHVLEIPDAGICSEWDARLLQDTMHAH